MGACVFFEPAPPSKPKEADEGPAGPGESQDSPLRLKYEEPEYDIPAFGFDSEPELTEEPTEDSGSGDRRPTQPRRPSPASSLQRARFKVGGSTPDCNGLSGHWAAPTLGLHGRK